MKSLITVASRILALTLSLAPVIAPADSSILTGSFDGAERTMPRAPEPFYCNDRSAGFRAVPFEVSQTGAYGLSDPYWSYFYWQGWNAGYTFQIHQGSFEPSATQKLEPLTDGRFTLHSGRPYSLVVHAKCPGFEGAWAAGIYGPGAILSDAVAELPGFSRGEFTPQSPTMTSDCGSGFYDWGWGPVADMPYEMVGPVRLGRGGQYYYGAASGAACLAIYTAPVDPANRQANRVAVLSGFDTTATLEAGTDYWFVSQFSGWDRNSRYGEYLHVLVPPANFRINSGLNGAWYDPETPGEGYFITVFDTRNQVFLANFTHTDQTIPGDPYGHRWYTAAGEFSDDSAELDLEQTAGGAFNADLPVPQQTSAGRVQLQFSDCAHGSIVVDTGVPDGPSSNGQHISLNRLASDWEQICKTNYTGPDEVGPL